MNRAIIILAIVLIGASLVSFPGNAQTVDSATIATCTPPYPASSSASISAGFINFCMYYPQNVQPGSTFFLTSILTAPASTTPVFLAAGSAFTAVSGCTEGTPSSVLPTSNGGVGTMVTYATTFTMTGEQCDFTASATLTIGAVPINIYSTAMAGLIVTENVRQDNFNYLCDAPSVAPNAYSVTATTCNDPNLDIESALSGSLELTGAIDTHTPDAPEASLLDMSLVAPLLLLVLLILWAESRRNEPILYVLAIVTGIIAVIGTWSDVSPETRIIMVGVVMFVGYRLYTIPEPNSE